MKLRITAKDITGANSNPHNCPIARAATRRFKTPATAGRGLIFLPDMDRNAVLSKEGRDFVEAWDKGGRRAVRPTSVGVKVL